MTLFAIATLLIALPFGFLLEQVTSAGMLTRWDTWAANELHETFREQPLAVTVLKIVTFLGNPAWFYVIISGAAIYVAARRRLRLAAFLVATTLLGGALNTTVKNVVGRPRPSLREPLATAFGESFPSGHAMMSVVGYGALLLVFLPVIPRRVRAAAIALTASLVLAIGFSRLALGVHYITDVLGGYVLGLAWLAASTAAFSTWRVDRGQRPVDVGEGLEPEAAEDLV